MNLWTFPKSKTVWMSKIEDCLWRKNKTIDNGQKIQVPLWKDTDVLLTEDLVNFFPTQNQLKKYTFYVSETDVDKFYLPYFELRDVNKQGKVVNTELKLKIIDPVVFGLELLKIGKEVLEEC